MKSERDDIDVHLRLQPEKLNSDGGRSSNLHLPQIQSFRKLLRCAYIGVQLPCEPSRDGGVPVAGDVRYDVIRLGYSSVWLRTSSASALQLLGQASPAIVV